MNENKAVELIKTVVCAVLLVSLVCLCAIYIFGFGGVPNAGLSKSVMAALKRQSSKNEYSRYFSADYVIPEFIGVVSSDGRRVGAFADTADVKVRTLYSGFSVYLKQTFGGEGKVSSLSRAEGERKWREVLSGDSIYMDFCGEIPRSIIYFMTFPDASDENVGNEFISELAIFPVGEPTVIKSTDVYGGETISKLYAFSVLARNRHGEYYLFESDFVPKTFTDVYFGMERIFSYNMSGMFSFEFDYGDCYTGMTVRTEDLSAPEVFITPRDITGSEEATSRMAEAFGINYEKSARYYESDGAVSYIEEGHNIKLYRDGRIVYTVTGNAGGVRLNSGSGNSDIYDYIGMSIKLIKASGAGDNVSLRLRGIYRNGKNTEVVFGYSCNNLSVSDGDGGLLRFEFSGEKLVTAELALYDIQSTKRYAGCPRRWYADIYGIEQSGKGRLIPLYVVGDGEKAVGASWLFAKASEVNEK